MASLTREAAQERAELLRVESYAVALDLRAAEDTGAAQFGSETTVRFACRQRSAGTFLDLQCAQLRSATLNGQPVDVSACFDVAAGRLTLSDLAAQNELVVDAVMAYSHDGEGLHRASDPADDRVYLCATSFLDAAPRWFGCFDQPDLKAPVTVDVRCPEDWVVAGNGPAQQLQPGRWRIAATRPLATYFTTVIAGPYYQVRDEHDGIPLVLHARGSLAPHLDGAAERLFAHTKFCLDELHRLFRFRYPWGEYHQAFVPEFNVGAMENPGCVTIRDEYLFRSRATDAELLDRDVLVAHEMAHMWFGDLVTMRWWDDLWLNESFAEYLGQRVTGPEAWTEFGARSKSWGYAADRRPSTHPVAGNGASDAATALTEFDGISYAKGASVLRQLAIYLGEDVFLRGLRGYVVQHSFGNAEFADLLAAWTAAGAHNLEDWTRAWLRTAGMDELAVEHGELVRRQPADRPGRRHSIAVAGFEPDGTERARYTVRITAERTVLPRTRAPFVLPDAGDETWAKIRLDAAAWAAMPATLAALGDPRARVAVWNALQLAVEDAEVDPALALDVVAAALPSERTTGTLSEVGGWAARRLAGALLTGSDRVAALARLCGVASAVSEVAEPGSGRQLAAIRLAAATTRDVDRLRGWLTNRGLPRGVEMDPDLRWSVLLRLAERGALSEAQLAEERSADRSSHGATHAARCFAARPDAETKAQAWNLLMTDTDRPNRELTATADGFWHPDQAELTDGYVPRYFAEVAEMARRRSGWLAESLTLTAFPWTAVRADTVAAGDRLIASPDLPTGARRSVVDATDDLRRAVEVRRRFARPTR